MTTPPDRNSTAGAAAGAAAGSPPGAGFVSVPRKQVAMSMTCVVLATFLAALSQTVVAAAMPRIVADLGGFDRYAWAITSYLVCATIAYPIVGRVSDLYGRRRFLVLGMAIFIVGSALVGASGSMTELVLFRAIQGIGGGIIMTCSYVAIADLFKPEERGKFHGLIGAVYGVASVAGPIAGGVIAERLSWNWMFFLIALSGIPVLALTARFFPKLRPSSGNTRMDWAGMLALILALLPLLVGLSAAGVEHEWTAAWTVGLLAFGLAMAALFIVIELRAERPIVPLQMFSSRVLSISVLVTLPSAFALYGGVIFLPLFFQIAKDIPAAGSGNLLAPMLLGIVFGGVLSGQLLSRAGGHYRVQALVGTGFMAVGMFLLSTMHAGTSIVLSEIYIVAAGFGFGAIVATLSVAVQNTVPYGMVGVATSALQFYRSLGGMLGIAVPGVVLTRRFSSRLDRAIDRDTRAALPAGRFEEMKHDPDALLDAAVAESLRADLAATGPHGAATADLLLDALRESLAGAVDDVFTVLAAVAAFALCAALFFRVAPDAPSPADGSKDS